MRTSDELTMMTQQQAADIMGISHRRAQTLEYQAIRKLHEGLLEAGLHLGWRPATRWSVDRPSDYGTEGE